MRGRRTRYGIVVAASLLLILSAAYLSVARNVAPLSQSNLQETNRVAVSDWSTYFNGALGGACLALLIVMLLLMPFLPWQVFGKTKDGARQQRLFPEKNRSDDRIRGMDD